MGWLDDAPQTQFDPGAIFGASALPPEVVNGQSSRFDPVDLTGGQALPFAPAGRPAPGGGAAIGADAGADIGSSAGGVAAQPPGTLPPEISCLLRERIKPRQSGGFPANGPR